MKPILFCVAAMVCYAVGNVILDLKFGTKYNNLVLMVCYGVIIVPLACIALQITKTDDPSFNWPSTKDELWALAFLGICFFGGEYFYIGAYTCGGNTRTVTSVAVVLPVMVATIKFHLNRELPTPMQMVGCAMTMAGVLIFVFNSKQK
jgi:drug/metabolite transporter (DMT)-like permease